jgi:hypothetical protein
MEKSRKIMSDEYTDEGPVENHIGPLYPLRDNAIHPMYSYNTPANCFWTGVVEGLRYKGWNEEEIVDWLQSKETRWLFDERGGEVTALGNAMVDKAKKIHD